MAENESSAKMAEATYRAEAHVGVSASVGWDTCVRRPENRTLAPRDWLYIVLVFMPSAADACLVMICFSFARCSSTLIRTTALRFVSHMF